MSYYVKITNNADGSVLVDEKNAIAILGVVNDGERVQHVAYGDCSEIELAFTLHQMKNLDMCICEKYPSVESLRNAIKDD